MKLLFDYRKVNFFDINENGIQLIDHGDSIEIYNDPFRTVPLFLTRNNSNELVIFSKFDEYFELKSVDRTIDEAGFWEIVLFGGGLWTRTLYKNVEQMPAATFIKINKKNEDFSIERYWNFDIREDESIQSIEQAADGLYQILNDIFSKLDKKQRYILGMSGGMDSRVTLAFLSKHVPRNNIKLFTYGFDKKILEYVYAKDVAYALDIKAPVFHQLDPTSYKDALNYLPKMSGGQVSINHCHIIDFFKKNSLADLEHITTYFSDALFGWDCEYPKKIQDTRLNYYAEVVANNSTLKFEIKNTIINDSLKIFNSYDPKANFSSLDEFKYVTERNQKFHTLLASLQSKFVSTIFIYASMPLLNYALSVPLKYRQNKGIIDVLLDKYFKNISSRFHWGAKYSGLLNWYIFRFINGANSILRILTLGKLQFFNKYQTEEHERLLYHEFKTDLHLATAKFLTMGILSPEQKKEFDKLPIRSAGIEERYALISLAKIL